ncbi:MAG: AAA family ATPase [Eubacteriales bacterium]|nr:AAA family ATPase [Eubacteriales bacterium]
MERFYLKNIELLNFRRFDNSTYELNPQMNVFIGKNASGKTTVLEAATVILGAYLAAFKEYVPSRFGHNISDNDVLRKSLKPTKGIAVTSSVKQFPCTVSSQIVWNKKIIECVRSLEKEGGRTKFVGKNPMREFVAEWEKAIKAADGSDEGQIYPLVLYLSSARLWNENRTGEIEKTPGRTDAYQRCLDQKRGNQTSFEYIKLLGSLASEENDGKPLPAYEVIMDAVKYSLQDELSPGQQVLYSSRYGEIAVKNSDGTIIDFSALSDGYRNVIKIVTDIATKMCILNPYLEKDTLKLTPGVVVIDELDLSLHPTWQRRIVRILKELFPRVQFICATHSPFIIQSLEPGELITLDTILDEEYSGQSIEDIAEDIMKVPVAQYSEKKLKMYKAAEEYFNALKGDVSQEKLQELKERLDVLSAEYSDNPAYYAWMKMKYLEKKVEVEG